MLEALIGGLIQGAYYALMGMGLVLIYRQSGIVNFAQGAFASFGAYITFALLDYVPYWGAALAAVVATAALASLTDLLIVRRLLRSSEITGKIGTIGVALFLIGGLSWAFGTTQLSLRPPILADFAVAIGPVSIGINALIAIVMALALAAAIYLLLDRTRFGLLVRAASEGPVTASMLGLNVAWLRTSVWAISGVLCTVSALLVTPANYLGPSFATDFMVVAFVALVLGGLDNMAGVLIGSFAFGLLDSFFAYFVAGALTEVLAFACVSLVLLVLPNGLLGRRLQRVREPTLRAAATAGRLRLNKIRDGLTISPVYSRIIFAAGLLLFLVLPFLISSTQTFVLALAFSLFFAVLSQTLLSGYVGLVSLGQAAFMGIGGYTVLLSTKMLGLTTVPAIVLAVICGGFFAAIFSIAAARLSGVYLILLTFTLSLAFPAAIAFPQSITGGHIGMAMPPLQMLGFTVTTEKQMYYVTGGLVILLGVPLALILRGWAGRICRAVRDSELGASASGINVPVVKVIAFGMSGALAALSGALESCLIGYIVPESFSIWQSVFLLIAAIIGGASVLGAFVGAIFLQYILFMSSNLPNLPYVGLGIIVVLALFLAPQGIANLFHADRRKKLVAAPQHALASNERKQA